MTKLAKDIPNIFIKFSLLIVGFRYKLEEIRSGSSKHEVDYTLKISTDFKPESLDLMLDEARRIKQEEEERRKVTDEKNKVLLTICGLLIAADSILFASLRPKWPVLLPLIPAAISIILILSHFRVERVVIVDWPDWKQGLDETKELLARNNLECANDLSPKNDYRVDIYRAASIYIALSLILVVIIFIFGVFLSSEETRNYNINFNF